MKYPVLFERHVIVQSNINQSGLEYNGPKSTKITLRTFLLI